MPDAHSAVQHFTILEFFPEHTPRESDPHYATFNATRRRLKKLGALKCWIGNEDCAGGIELHHALVEFALINMVDVPTFSRLYPEFDIKSDEDFLNSVESEGGLLPLCLRHHRGDIGIHSLLYSPFLVQRFKKAHSGLPAQRLPES